VSLVPTVGHTPAHASVRIASRGAEALITGDFVHHPAGGAARVAGDAASGTSGRARRTRSEVFGRLAGTGTLLIGTHFAMPTAGRVVRDGGAYRLEV
jgi:glyoxylase-like metal-dependent hydrolase (beta-lactamase superfamily II)